MMKAAPAECLKRVRRRNYGWRSGQLVFVRNFQGRMVVATVGRDGPLEPRQRSAVLELERADLIVEPRVAVLEAPADRGARHARRARQRTPDQLARAREAGLHAAALVRAQRVAERRAGRLPDTRLDAAPLREADLRQVRV